MRVWLRPAAVVLLLLGLAGLAAWLYLRGLEEDQPRALPVAENDREIAWLDLATSTANWEQFVASVDYAKQSLQGEFPGLSVEKTDPDKSPAVPEVVLSRPEGPRLVFRWYKITSDFRTNAWVKTLLERSPPPLAIIGGSSTNRARELAYQLHARENKVLPELQPLLLITTATADRVEAGPGRRRIPRVRADLPAETANEAITDEHLQTQDTDQVWLSELYPGRTFRFGFTNLQMADAIVQFVWSQPDLRPDVDPAHLIRWDDDTYSRDLVNGFWKALRQLGAREAVRELLWGLDGLGGPFPGVGGVFPFERAGPHASGFGQGGRPLALVHPIDAGVGGFDHPNVFESPVVEGLVRTLHAEPDPHRRVLLAVTGQSQPARRFLRGLVRLSPASTRRVVVVMGDALSFNTVYRDRQILWSIQDLPFPVCFFCHYNPVDPDAGRENPATGTDELLLDTNLVTQVVRAAWGERPARNGEELRLALAEARLDGKPFFDARGQRRSGSGEYVVCLRPLTDHDPPRSAKLSVWLRRLDETGRPAWVHQGPDLDLTYDDLAWR